MSLWKFTTNEPSTEIITFPPVIGFDVYLSFNKEELRHLKECAKAAGFTGEELLEYIRSAALGRKKRGD